VPEAPSLKDVRIISSVGMCSMVGGIPSDDEGTITSNVVMGSGSACSAIIGDP